MYAIVKTGGKQYVVRVGDCVKVEKLTAGIGDSVTLGQVLYVGGDSPVAGSPWVEGASVTAEVLAQGKDARIKGFTYKPKKHTHRRYGHRQLHTEVRVTGINV